MKVLYALANLCDDSGVTSVVMNIYRHLSKENIQIDFLVCGKMPEKEPVCYNEILSNGGKIYHVGNVLHSKTMFSSLKNIKQIFKEHAQEYQAIHLHSPNMSHFILKYAKQFGIPNRIIHSHSSMTSPNKIKAMLNRILMSGKRYANMFWTCSPEAADFLYGKDFSKKHPVEMMKNAVDKKTFYFDKDVRDALKREFALENKKVITHVSNFSPIKNLFFLLPVIQQVVKKYDDFVFLFIGDGPTKNEMEQKVKEMGLEKYVRFVGRQPEVCKFLCASDLLLLPSLKEGLPVVTIEAQACGLPCFVTDTITNECDIGLIEFLPLHAELWADRICTFSIPSDDARLQKSEHFAESPYNIINEAKRVENLYLNLL